MDQREVEESSSSSSPSVNKISSNNNNNNSIPNSKKEEEQQQQQQDDQITIDIPKLELTIMKDFDGNPIPIPNFFTCCRSGDSTTLKLLIEAYNEQGNKLQEMFHQLLLLLNNKKKKNKQQQQAPPPTIIYYGKDYYHQKFPPNHVGLLLDDSDNHLKKFKNSDNKVSLDQDGNKDVSSDDGEDQQQQQQDEECSPSSNSIFSKIASFFTLGTSLANKVTGGNSPTLGSSPNNSSGIFSKVSSLESNVDQLSPHAKNKSFSRSPLSYACRFGHLDCVKLLIENIPHLQFSNETSHKWTLLHDCAVFGRVEVMDYLFHHTKTADLMRSMCCKTNRFGSTPLHICCKNGHSDAAQYLVLQGPIPYDKFSCARHQTFLQIALEEEMKDFCIALLKKYTPILLNNNSDNDNKNSGDSSAVNEISGGKLHVKVVVHLVELICSKDSFKTNCLHYACVRPSDEFYEVLLRLLCILHEYVENPTVLRTLLTTDSAGYSVFHYAMGGNSFKCAFLLYHYYLLSLYRNSSNNNLNNRSSTFSKLLTGSNSGTNNNNSGGTSGILDPHVNPMNIQTGSLKHSPIFLACKYNHVDLLKRFLLIYKDNEELNNNFERNGHLDICFEENSLTEKDQLKQTSLYQFLRFKSKEELNFVKQAWKQIRVTDVYDKLGNTPATVNYFDEGEEVLNDLFSNFNEWKLE
ncbi:hypothetical protein ABK040_001425 [Willaertia magna]